MKKLNFGTTAALIGIALGSSIPAAQAGNLEYFYQRMLRERDAATALNYTASPFLSFVRRVVTGSTDTPSAIQGGLFRQRINHADTSDTRLFNQRYFIDSSLASGPDAPVLYYICGEAACDPRELSVGAIRQYAAKYHAHLVTLEHRYYGKSQPFPTLTTENLRYLTMANALADLEDFSVYAQSHFGMKGKWISVGGSYAGALSAFYRLKHPNAVAGALSSSGPVRAWTNFEEYDLAVRQAAGPQCADAILSLNHEVEAQLNNPATRASIKALFESSMVTDDVDFLYIVADMAAGAIQYGHRDEFCQAVTGPEPLKAYAATGIALFKDMGMTPESDAFGYALSTDPAKYEGSLGMRQWMWQSCTEFGYYQTAYHDPKLTTRSLRIDLAYHNEACRRLFGLTKQVDTDATNHEFYNAILGGQATNILFINGSTDQWSRLSITDPKLLPNASLATYVVDGGSHCTDLSTAREADSASLKGARALFMRMADGWLK